MEAKFTHQELELTALMGDIFDISIITSTAQ